MNNGPQRIAHNIQTFECDCDDAHENGHPLPPAFPADSDVGVFFDASHGIEVFPFTPAARAFFAIKTGRPSTVDDWKRRAILLPPIPQSAVTGCVMEVEMLMAGLTVTLAQSHGKIFDGASIETHRPDNAEQVAQMKAAAGRMLAMSLGLPPGVSAELLPLEGTENIRGNLPRKSLRRPAELDDNDRHDVQH